MSHTQGVVATGTGATGSGGLQSASRNETLSRTKSWRQRSRVIRRLVTLFDNIQDLIDTALVRHQSLGQTDQQYTAWENWLFRTYEVLTARIPCFHEWISNPANLRNVTDMHTVVRQLCEGADSARADDTSLLKDRVVFWVAEEDPLQPHLSPPDKVRHGFYHDIMGRLICLVDYNWDNPEQRAKI
ncbi:hypothetical protein HD554DRAFT_2172643 [Boletus coccyginus]|nr:hypothetical protein HD554DRAFT_2172643 [Boletus coccyginus]